MTRWQRIGVGCLCAAMAAAMVVPPMLRGAAPARPAGTPASRTPEAILKDMEATQERVTDVLPALTLLGDPDFRAGEGKKAIPLIKKISALLDELDTAIKSDTAISREERDQMREGLRVNRYQMYSYLAALGDQETEQLLQTTAKGSDANAVSAKVSLLLSQWMSDSRNAAAQAQLLDDFTPVVKANPKNGEIIAALGFISNVGAANADSLRKAIGVIRDDLPKEAVDKMLAGLDSVQLKRDMIDKPLVLEGQTNTRSKLSTASFKGKVVLVDFWATWCPPCIEQLPELKKLYTAYHGQGLEIVGVSSDSSVDPLNKFVKEKDIPWPQFQEDFPQDKTDPPLNVIARKFKLAAIPALLLIDRDGVLRFADFADTSTGEPVHFRLGKNAGKSLEDQVAALIKESPKADPK